MYEFKLPDLGEGVHEGEVLKWHVGIGEHVKEDEPLVDVETDKAAVTIPSPKSGTLQSRAGDEGDIVIVGTVLCTIDDGSAGAGASASGTGAATAATTATTTMQHSEASSGVAAGNGQAPTATTKTQVVGVGAHPFSTAGQAQGQRALAAPATRRLAREKGVDINLVPGSGTAGRVTPDDVLAFLAGGGARGSVTEQIAQTAAAQDELAGYPEALPAGEGGQVPFLTVEPLPDYSRFGEVEKEPLRSIRRKIAYRMTTSAIMAPHVYHMDEADVTDLEAQRRELRRALAAEDHPGAKLTLLAFAVKALVKGLKEVPAFNASIDPVRNEIVYKKFYNIGIAVAAPHGLVVPVLRGCDQKSVTEIAAGIVELAEKARANELAAEDFQGGCFTVTNMGALGGTNAIPMINYPEVAILAMARVQEKPVVRDGRVVVRSMLPLTLSFDHRIGDGSHAATFMNGLVRRLSDPQRLMVEV